MTQECTFSFPDFISSPYLLFLRAHQFFSFPLRWCDDDFQSVDGGCFLVKIPSAFPMLEKSHRQNHYGYWLINISLRTPKAPAFTHLSLPVLCQFQLWGMPWSWNRHKVQMNQCPISHVLCLQARQSNYHPTRCPCWPSRTNRRSKSITAIRGRFICDSSGSSAQAPPTGALHTPQHSFRSDSCTKGMGKTGPGLVYLNATAPQGWRRSSVVRTSQEHF